MFRGSFGGHDVAYTKNLFFLVIFGPLVHPSGSGVFGGRDFLFKKSARPLIIRYFEHAYKTRILRKNKKTDRGGRAKKKVLWSIFGNLLHRSHSA